LFGALDVRLDGAPIPPLRTRKVQWLLALLLLHHDQALDRVWLAGTLWPESAPGAALFNLRQSLSNLRRALGPAERCLQASMVNALTLDAAPIEADVIAFDTAVAAGDRTSLEQAVSLYRGPLLEGCAEEWVFAERRVREEQYLSALEKLAEQALGRGERDVAATYLRSVIQVDPLREQTQRALIQTLAAMGDHGAAVQVYRDLRVLLRRDLNTDPDPETQAVFQQVRAEALSTSRTAPPAIAPLPAPPTTRRPLPCPLTTLVGRQTEIEEIRNTLKSARLVTLTGPGGVGKTRLAIAVGEQVAEAYQDGVCFVDLAPLSEPDLLAQTVAGVLEAPEEPGRSVLSTLQDYLQARSMLLLLDNCEHLLDRCADLVYALLQSCPGVHVLATSRQNLGLTGEVGWKVDTLSTPSLSNLTTRDRPQKDRMSLLSEYDAVQLFVVRAQQAMPAFQMTAQNAEEIARICAHLDGLPLALELAAARVLSLSVAEIQDRLADRFRLLTGGSRAALPRQKSLRALLDWSYDLLNPAEQTLLRRLSVFAGGFTLQAAAVVCPEESLTDQDTLSEEDAYEAWETLDLLSSLVDKSLILAEHEAGRTRYRLLETMRQYAQDRLQECGETDRVKQRHQAFFVALAEEAEPQLLGPEQAAWLHRLETDHDNLRQALDGGDPEGALRLAGALWRYLKVRGYFSEGRLWSVRALEGETGRGRPSVRAKALHGAGILAVAQGDYKAARAYHEESLALYRKDEEESGIADALLSLGNIASEQGDYTTARTLYSESLEIRRRTADRHGISTLLNNLGSIASELGDPRAAQTLYEESLQLRRELGNRVGIAGSLNNLGNVAMDLEDYAKARALFSESLALQRELGNRLGTAMALYSLGIIASEYEEFAATHRLYEESLFLYQELGYKRGIACTLEALGALALTEDQAVRAAQLLSAAESLRNALGTHLSPFDQKQHDTLVEQARAALGEERFADAWSEGSALTVEQAIGYACSALSRQ